MGFYVCVDLHSSNSFLAVIDEERTPVLKRRLPNDLERILDLVGSFQNINGIAVESTYNWYWLVDGLMEAGYQLHLAHPSAMAQYSGMKHRDDKDDAFWLAQMLSMDILPTGYIYPKDVRPVRDMLRKRSMLVKQRTANLTSLQSMINRWYGVKISSMNLKKPMQDNGWQEQHSQLFHHLLICYSVFEDSTSYIFYIIY